ncbi:hypothetical protein [Staphylococcus pasteuri_A]|nr:hypothetical protein [Staphylococcus pasteuri_A]
MIQQVLVRLRLNQQVIVIQLAIVDQQAIAIVRLKHQVIVTHSVIQ